MTTGIRTLLSRQRWFCVSLLLLLQTGWGYSHAIARVVVIPTPHEGIAPDAEIDATGAIHLVYVSGENAYYVRSTGLGESFSDPIQINTESDTVYGGAYRGPDIALGKQGQVHVIWYTNAYQRKLPHEEWGVFYSHLNASGDGFVPARNLNHRPSDNYAIAADAQGHVAIFWMAGEVLAQMSRDGGETFSEPQKVDGADPCECCASRAHFSQDGSLHFIYREKANNVRDMYLVTFQGELQSVSRDRVSLMPWIIDVCPMTGTFLTESTDNTLVAGWETKGQIRLATFKPGVGRASNVILAADSGKYPVALSAADGTMLAAWKDGTTLRWQVYDSNGERHGDPGSVADTNPNRPSGVVTHDGDFLLFP